MKIRILVAATSAALFALGANAAGDEQKQSPSSQGMSTSSQSAAGGASGSQSAAGGATGGSQQAQRSDIVKQVQQKLSQEGHKLQADGIMGPKTQAALKEYQQSKGLEATGQLDKETLSALGVSGDMSGGASATGGTGSGKSESPAASGSSSSSGQSQPSASGSGAGAGSSSGQSSEKK